MLQAFGDREQDAQQGGLGELAQGDCSDRGNRHQRADPDTAMPQVADRIGHERDRAGSYRSQLDGFRDTLVADPPDDPAHSQQHRSQCRELQFSNLPELLGTRFGFGGTLRPAACIRHDRAPSQQPHQRRSARPPSTGDRARSAGT